MSKFGFLLRLEFLQNWASAFVAGLNPAVMHNLEKYYALKKVFYLSAIEDIEGDYLEFGVFRGSSFVHAIRCCRKLAKLNPRFTETRFYGFDSFAGFGSLQEEDRHPYYTDENFTTSLSQVERRIRKASGSITFRLVPGFFNESLRLGAQKYGIEAARIVFIDSDTFASSSQALAFCLPTIRQGTLIVLDDYFSYRGRNDRGVRRAFSEFTKKYGIEVRHVFTYGMGGVVFVVSAEAVGTRDDHASEQGLPTAQGGYGAGIRHAGRVVRDDSQRLLPVFHDPARRPGLISEYDFAI